MTEEQRKYRMTMSLNVLHHLGIGLYSNVPAVLSEVVANSWDADATTVDIKFKADAAKGDMIEILDNGCGMSLEDINNKYLNVGYQKRKDIEGGSKTKRLARDVMGRKGLGKLSLFSIANIVEIHTMKNGVKNGLVMNAINIEDSIERQGKGELSASGTYSPDEIPEENLKINDDGTLIILSDLKKHLVHTSDGLRKRIARRFSIIGDENNFHVKVDGKEISVADRDYFYKLQYIWYYGDESKVYADQCDEKKTTMKIKRNNSVTIDGPTYPISGWIGSVVLPTDLRDESGENLNKITILARGKMAHEDVLGDFQEGQLYTGYLIGEIDADFLDLTEKEDIATSNRQKVKEDDPRFLALKGFIKSELSVIGGSWKKQREEDGVSRATKDPIVRSWYDQLGPSYREKAGKLFGKLNKIPLDSEEERAELIKSSILAFETYQHKKNLDALDDLDVNDIVAIGKLFRDSDEIESAIYYQLVRGRVGIIETLMNKVREGALEKVIQEYIGEHLWLLDPSWERATETPSLEYRIKEAFDAQKARAGKDEKDGRIDILYRKTTGAHVIIELKKPDVRITSHKLEEQVERYIKAIKEELRNAGKPGAVEAVCLIGTLPTNWTDDESTQRGISSLATYNMRVVTYAELLDNAYAAYKNYLEARTEARRIADLLEKIDVGLLGG